MAALKKLLVRGNGIGDEAGAALRAAGEPRGVCGWACENERRRGALCVSLPVWGIRMRNGTLRACVRARCARAPR